MMISHSCLEAMVVVLVNVLLGWQIEFRRAGTLDTVRSESIIWIQSEVSKVKYL